MKNRASLCESLQVLLSIDEIPPLGTTKNLDNVAECSEDDHTLEATEDLLQDTINRIVDHLEDDHAALQTCSLIGHKWLSSSRRYLARHLHIFASDIRGDASITFRGWNARAFLAKWGHHVESLTFSARTRGEKIGRPGPSHFHPGDLAVLLNGLPNLRHLKLVQCSVEPWCPTLPLWETAFTYHPLETLSLVPSLLYSHASVWNTLFYFRRVTIGRLELLHDNCEPRIEPPPGPTPPAHRPALSSDHALRGLSIGMLYVADRVRSWAEGFVHGLCAIGAYETLELDHWGFSHWSALATEESWAGTLSKLTHLKLSVGPLKYYTKDVPGMRRREDPWWTTLSACTALRSLTLVVRAYKLALPGVAEGVQCALEHASPHLTDLTLELDFRPSPKYGTEPIEESLARLDALLEESHLQDLLWRFAELDRVVVCLAPDCGGDSGEWRTHEVENTVIQIVEAALPKIGEAGMLFYKED